MKALAIMIPVVCLIFMGKGYAADDDAAFFTKSVMPILTDNCINPLSIMLK